MYPRAISVKVTILQLNTEESKNHYKMEGKLMWVIITNCCYMRGGSRVPRRIRKFQNVRTLLTKEQLEWSDTKILDHLWYWFKGRQRPTLSSKIKRTGKYY